MRSRHSLLPVCFSAAICLNAQGPTDFARDVQPVFEKYCYSCHGDRVQNGGLRLDLKQSAESRIVPGNASESEIYRRVAGLGNRSRMPMGGKLAPAQIEAIKNWIGSGAVWQEPAAASAPKPKHWAFIAPVRP